MKSIKFMCMAALTVLLALSLTGCGSSDTGTLSLSVTDAPVDGAVSIVVQFTGVQLLSTSGELLTFNFETPKTIDLLKLQGGDSALLLDNISVPEGDYPVISLKVNAEQGVLDSYIELADGTKHSLWIPSANETGLMLTQGCSVTANGVADFVIDFDLRKSVFDPDANLGEDYILKPALRMVDNTEAGSIAGTVDVALTTDATCTSGNAVYIYEGLNVTPDDVGSQVEPVATTLITDTNTYKAAFLEPGDYTVAFTCQAADDNPKTDDAITFVGAVNVTVSVGVETPTNLQP
ncbi:putative lipoprotein [hydrothermal vent metagenome]|uniref:Putative lipoprotein n=1 Tax=hydrothermal vent metagenome TaxID=652676 RepID=A0A3B1CXA4_9ZZZZ